LVVKKELGNNASIMQIEELEECSVSVFVSRNHGQRHWTASPVAPPGQNIG
jgi:hypothetical protein